MLLLKIGVGANLYPFSLLEKICEGNVLLFGGKISALFHVIYVVLSAQVKQVPAVKLNNGFV